MRVQQFSRHRRGKIQRLCGRRGARWRLRSRKDRGEIGCCGSSRFFWWLRSALRSQHERSSAGVFTSRTELDLHRQRPQRRQRPRGSLFSFTHSRRAGSVGKRYWFSTKTTLNKLVVQYRQNTARENIDSDITSAIAERTKLIKSIACQKTRGFLRANPQTEIFSTSSSEISSWRS